MTGCEVMGSAAVKMEESLGDKLVEKVCRYPHVYAVSVTRFSDKYGVEITSKRSETERGRCRWCSNRCSKQASMWTVKPTTEQVAFMIKEQVRALRVR